MIHVIDAIDGKRAKIILRLVRLEELFEAHRQRAMGERNQRRALKAARCLEAVNSRF
jgi:hypothetical protein